MAQLASKSQLRWSLARVALVTVPLTLLLGSLSGRASGSGDENPWFEGLVKPALQPPGWAFGLAWTILYTLMGLAVAMVIAARGARGRGIAVGLFVVQLALNLAWSPLFFRLHRIMDAFWLIVAILVAAIATTVAFGRVRRVAAWLMVPYLV